MASHKIILGLEPNHFQYLFAFSIMFFHTPLYTLPCCILTTSTATHVFPDTFSMSTPLPFEWLFQSMYYSPFVIIWCVILYATRCCIPPFLFPSSMRCPYYSPFVCSDTISRYPRLPTRSSCNLWFLWTIECIGGMRWKERCCLGHVQMRLESFHFFIIHSIYSIRSIALGLSHGEI